MAGGGLGAFLAGFGPGLSDALEKSRRARQQEEDASIRRMMLQNYLKQQTDQSQAESAFLGGLGGLGGGGGDLAMPQPVGGGVSPVDQITKGGTPQSSPYGMGAPTTTRTPGKGYGMASSLAMAQPEDVQRDVASRIATTGGAQHWANFNPKLKSDLLAAGLPTSGPVSPEQLDQFLQLVRQDESGGKNVPNFRFDPTHTAGGFYQITNSTWNAFGGPRGGGGQARTQPASGDMRQQYDAGRARYAQNEGQYGPGFYNSEQGQGKRPSGESLEQYQARFSDGMGLDPSVAGKQPAPGGPSPDAIRSGAIPPASGNLSGGGRGPMPAASPGSGSVTAQPAQFSPDAAPPEIRQQSDAAAQKTGGAIQAQMPQIVGKMSLDGLVQQIRRNNPGISDHAAVLAVQKLLPFVSQQQRQQWEVQKFQYENAIRRQEKLEDRSLDEQRHRRERVFDNQNMPPAREGFDIFKDAEGQEHYLRKGDSIPRGWHRPSEERGNAQTTGREKDIEGEIARKDRAFRKANPDASEDDIAAEHFKNRQQAEKGLAESKATPARSMSGAMARKYLEAHPDATAEDLVRLGGSARREQSIQTAFAGGEAARQVRSLNTLADHITLTREYGDALRNGDIPRANKILNQWAIETGHPEVNDFNAARTIMADEVVRLLTNTGGTEQDRKDMQAIFDANSSPEQIAGAANVATRFVAGRLGALEQQYARNDPSRRREFQETMLSPGAKQFFTARVPGATEKQGPIMPGQGQQGAAQGKYSVGQVIEKGGKKYRVMGGDLNGDPDVEPMQ